MRDQLSPFGGKFLRDQTSDGNTGFVGIGDIGVAIGEGQLFCFNHQVQILGGVVPQGLEIEAFEDVQHFERGNSLRLRAELVNIVTMIVR